MEKTIEMMLNEGGWFLVSYNMRSGGVWADSYDYEDYTFFNPTTNEVEYKTGYYTSFSSNLDEGFPHATKEVLDKYYKWCVESRKKSMNSKFEYYKKVCEELNEAKNVQEKGQIVEIVGSGKHHGKVGKISWIGKNKFNRSYTRNSPRAEMWLAVAKFHNNPFIYGKEDYDLVRVIPTDGSKPFYVALDACKVVEGFKPYECTTEWFKNFYKNHNNDSWKISATWNGVNKEIEEKAVVEAVNTWVA